MKPESDTEQTNLEYFNYLINGGALELRVAVTSVKYAEVRRWK